MPKVADHAVGLPQRQPITGRPAGGASLDHLVGAREQGRRKIDRQRLCGIKINHQLELGRLHNRQLGDLGTFQNSCRVNADQSKGIGQARSITDQATPSGCFRGKSARRSGSQLADKPLAVAEKARSFANC